jgi:hypothetical protein
MTQCQKIDIQIAQPETSDIILHKRNLNVMANSKNAFCQKNLIVCCGKTFADKGENKDRS